MSLHNFNPNNKSWKMYSNTLTSISGDNLTVKPYDGRNLLLEVSGNNNIFFKRGDISYGLDDLIGGGNSNITLTSVSGDIIPSSNNAFKLGDISKNWRNAYIRDLSVSNISVSGNIIIPANSINSSHIADGSILGTDISSATITGSNIADGTIPFTKLDNAFQSVLGSFYTGIFEITCNTSINVDFYYQDNANNIYLFQNEEISDANTNFITYGGLPNYFATIPFYLESDQDIVSYSLTQVDPRNGITNHSQVGAGKIQFDILRNSQHYLELNILIYGAPVNTGFYGTLDISNLSREENYSISLQAQLAYNSIGITSYITISGGTSGRLTIPIGSRLPDPSSLLQLRVILSAGAETVDPGDFSGVTPVSFTQYPLTQENTIELLVDNDKINGGNLLLEFFVNNGTGFYGTFDITNQVGGEMSPISFQAKLAYNNVDITSYITIASGTTQTLTVPIGLRLPEASSYLQLKVIVGAGVQSLDPGQNSSGFTPVSSTENPLTEENTLELLVDSGENSQINGGNLILTIVVSS